MMITIAASGHGIFTGRSSSMCHAWNLQNSTRRPLPQKPGAKASGRSGIARRPQDLTQAAGGRSRVVRVGWPKGGDTCARSRCDGATRSPTIWAVHCGQRPPNPGPAILAVALDVRASVLLPSVGRHARNRPKRPAPSGKLPRRFNAGTLQLPPKSRFLFFICATLLAELCFNHGWPCMSRLHLDCSRVLVAG